LKSIQAKAGEAINTINTGYSIQARIWTALINFYLQNKDMSAEYRTGQRRVSLLLYQVGF
jgi:hypothetical protein